MQLSRESNKKKKKLLTKGSCRAALCCTSCSRTLSSSSSSSSEGSETAHSDRYTSVSSLAHAMVQERLDQMIKERQDRRREELTRRRSKEIRKEGKTKFIVMVAMEKHSYDPRQDFKESLMEMISANHIEKARDLRRLLNYYLSQITEMLYLKFSTRFAQICSSGVSE